MGKAPVEVAAQKSEVKVELGLMILRTCSQEWKLKVQNKRDSKKLWNLLEVLLLKCLKWDLMEDKGKISKEKV